MTSLASCLSSQIVLFLKERQLIAFNTSADVFNIYVIIYWLYPNLFVVIVVVYLFYFFFLPRFMRLEGLKSESVLKNLVHN